LDNISVKASACIADHSIMILFVPLPRDSPEQGLFANGVADNSNSHRGILQLISRRGFTNPKPHRE